MLTDELISSDAPAASDTSHDGWQGPGRMSPCKLVGVSLVVCSIIFAALLVFTPTNAWNDIVLSIKKEHFPLFNRSPLPQLAEYPSKVWGSMKEEKLHTIIGREQLSPATANLRAAPPASIPASASMIESAANMAADAVSGRDVVLRRFRRWSPMPATPSESSSNPRSASAKVASKENKIPINALTHPGLTQYLDCINRASNNISSTSVLSGPRVAVITSVAPAPTLAMLQLLLLQAHWCVLVIGDLKSPDHPTYQFNCDRMMGSSSLQQQQMQTNRSKEEQRFVKHVEQQKALLDRFDVGWKLENNTHLRELVQANLAYLSAAEQKLLESVHPFFKLTPFRSFARKNLGYLLATWARAGIIFDVDDDNMYLPRSSSTVGQKDLPFFPGAREFGLPQTGQLQQQRQEERRSFQYIHFEKGMNKRHKTKEGGTHYESAAQDFQKGPSLLPSGAAYSVYNPYPHFGLASAWPRGFPLQLIGSSLKTVPKIPLPAVSNASQLCYPLVQQFLANVDPDVDAIWRMSSLEYEQGEGQGPLRRVVDSPSDRAQMHAQTFFMSFSAASKEMSVAVPSAASTPYNAQATLHLPQAYFALLLPMTVHGRVADIWRSYFTQTLMSYLEFPTVQEEKYSTPHDTTGAPKSSSTSSSFSVRVPGCLVFHPPHIAHFRNPHSYHADYMSEQPLYEQTPALLEFLQQRRKGQKHDLLTRIRRRNIKAQQQQQRSDEDSIKLSWSESETSPLAEDITSLQELLWMDLYEVGILERQDVEYMKAWINVLKLHEFPFDAHKQPLKRSTGPQEKSNHETTAATTSPSNAALPIQPPLHLPSLLPSPQNRVGVCVQFNFPCSPESLMRVIRVLQFLHSHITILNPLPIEHASTDVQAIMESNPTIGYVYAETNHGLYQIYSIAQCAEWYESLLVPNTTDPSNSESLDVDGITDSQFLMSDEGKVVSPVFPLSAPTAPLHGVFYTSDDLFFNLTQAMLPNQRVMDHKKSGNTNPFRLDRHWVMQHAFQLNITDCIPRHSWTFLDNDHQGRVLRDIVKGAPASWLELLEPYFGNTVPYASLADLVYLTAHQNALRNFLDLLSHIDARTPNMRGAISETFITWAVLLAQAKTNAENMKQQQATSQKQLEQHHLSHDSKAGDAFSSLQVGRIGDEGVLYGLDRIDFGKMVTLVLNQPHVHFLHPLKLSGYLPIHDFAATIPTSDSRSVQLLKSYPAPQLAPIVLRSRFESIQLDAWAAAESRQWQKLNQQTNRPPRGRSAIYRSAGSGK